MKIATWNVNSITAREPVVLRWLKEARPDVLCLQETKCIDEKFPRANFEALGYRVESHGQPTYNGVAILSLLPAEDVQRGFPDEEEGSHSRLIAGTVGGVRVVNVYVPNGQSVGTEKYKFKLDWLARLRDYLDEHLWADDEALLCGDFNVAPEDRDVHDPDLWRGRILFSEPEKKAIRHVQEWGFTDAFRMHEPRPGFYSWWDYRAGGFRRNEGLRIDHVWVSEPLAARCKRAWIDREPRGWERPSDHTAVVAEFK